MKHANLLVMALLLPAVAALGDGNKIILRESIVHNNLPAVSNYIESCVSIDTVEACDGQTALHVSAGNNRIDITQFLIAKHADVNARDYLGLTPLHWAACKGHTDMVALLLQHNAEINATDINGLTPLHLAAQYGHEAVITLLLDSGADLNARTYDRGMTPIHWAAFWGHTEGIKALLAYGADVNSRDSTGDTPMAWAEDYMHYDMARLIARKGGKRHLN